MSKSRKNEIMTVRVPQGTFKRISKSLKSGELRSGLIRVAVLVELKRREKEAQPDEQA